MGGLFRSKGFAEKTKTPPAAQTGFYSGDDGGR